LSATQVGQQLFALNYDCTAETVFTFLSVVTCGDQQELVQLLFKKSILGVMAGTEVQDFARTYSLQYSQTHNVRGNV